MSQTASMPGGVVIGGTMGLFIVIALAINACPRHETKTASPQPTATQQPTMVLRTEPPAQAPAEQPSTSQTAGETVRNTTASLANFNIFGTMLDAKTLAQMDIAQNRAVPHCGRITHDGMVCRVSPGGSGTSLLFPSGASNGDRICLKPGLESGAILRVGYEVNGKLLIKSPSDTPADGMSAIVYWIDPMWAKENGNPDGSVDLAIDLVTGDCPD